MTHLPGRAHCCSCCTAAHCTATGQLHWRKGQRSQHCMVFLCWSKQICSILRKHLGSKVKYPGLIMELLYLCIHQWRVHINNMKQGLSRSIFDWQRHGLTAYYTLRATEPEPTLAFQSRISSWKYILCCISARWMSKQTSTDTTLTYCYILKLRKSTCQHTDAYLYESFSPRSTDRLVGQQNLIKFSFVGQTLRVVRRKALHQ